ncbi:MAG: hypothetical protein U0841_20005 [Chloroflexia bacterium]
MAKAATASPQRPHSSTEQLRDPGMLDVYVANTPWCASPAAPPPPATLTSASPPPSPDPAAVAAGAPMRATLLPQIDAYDREMSACDTSTTDCRRVRPGQTATNHARTHRLRQLVQQR